MRKNIVAGNWKMNNNLDESIKLAKELKEILQKTKLYNVDIKIAPPFTNIYPILKELEDSKIEVISQNIHQKENGAFTGEVSANMIKSLGVKTTILGHSERREYFGETEDILREKVDTAIKNDLNIIFCVGEKLEDRKNKNHFEVTKKQIERSLFHLKENDWNKIILAYEPVWAIGTGETAFPEQAQEIHSFIRGLLKEKYGKTLSDNISILYGGSCKPSNAKEIFSQKDVDGGLIGGASLNANDFIEISKSF